MLPTICNNSVSTEKLNRTAVVASEWQYLFPYLTFIYALLIVMFLVIYYNISNNRSDVHQFLVLLLSGLTNVVTGIILFEVNKNDTFEQFDILLVLIPPLMGLKGNLEMTMASRMSTAMNTREDLISFNMLFKEISLDMCLVQSQATVVAFVTFVFATIGQFIEKPECFDGYNTIRICAITLLTANTACFVLGKASLISWTIIK